MNETSSSESISTKLERIAKLAREAPTMALTTDRFRRSLTRLSEWCRRNLHAPLAWQQKILNAKLRGHYGYFDRIGNRARLWNFLYRARIVWKRWLGRRSQRPLFWKRMNQLLERFPLLTPVQARRA